MRPNLRYAGRDVSSGRRIGVINFARGHDHAGFELPSGAKWAAARRLPPARPVSVASTVAQPDVAFLGVRLESIVWFAVLFSRGLVRRVAVRRVAVRPVAVRCVFVRSVAARPVALRPVAGGLPCWTGSVLRGRATARWRCSLGGWFWEMWGRQFWPRGRRCQGGNTAL